MSLPKEQTNVGWMKLPKFWNGSRWDWTNIPLIDSLALYHATTTPHFFAALMISLTLGFTLFYLLSMILSWDNLSINTDSTWIDDGILLMTYYWWDKALIVLLIIVNNLCNYYCKIDNYIITSVLLLTEHLTDTKVSIPMAVFLLAWHPMLISSRYKQLV